MAKVCIIFGIFFVILLLPILPKPITKNFFTMRNINVIGLKFNKINCKYNQSKTKNSVNNKNNDNKMRKNKCAQKINYKPLMQISVVYNTLKMCSQIKQLKSFCKNNLVKNIDLINKVAKIIKNNQNKYFFIKFRAINQISYIENIANYVVIMCGNKTNFNAIKYVNYLKNTQNLFKKEEKALYFLLLRAFYAKICILIKEVLLAEKIILKAKNNNKANTHFCKNYLKNCLSTYGKNIGGMLSYNSLELIRCKQSIAYFEDLNGEINNAILWAKFLINKNFV